MSPTTSPDLRQCYVRAPYLFNKRPVVTLTVSTEADGYRLLVVWAVEAAPATGQTMFKVSAQFEPGRGDDTIPYWCDFTMTGELDIDRPTNVSLDCRSLGHDWLILIGDQTGAVPSPTDPSAGAYFRARDRILNFFLEDGRYVVYVQSGNLSIVNFIVKDGIISYDPELEGVISGAGTNALVLHGLPITIDATEVQDFLVYIPAVYGLDGFDTSNASRPLFTGNFLPNCHDITDGWEYRFNIAGGVNASFTFKVQLNGLVAYKPEFDDSVTGRGTNVLKISSFTPFVDR
jgi:hypothetical protein